MKKINIIKSNDDFSKIIKHGKFVKDKNFVIYVLQNDLSKARFGVSVGTKIGKAHTRNKIKRQIRNIIDTNKNSFLYSKDYIVIARKNCLDEKFVEMKNSYDNLLKKINGEDKYEEK